MRVLIAPDSFKDSLSAVNVCKAIAEGLQEGCPYIEVEICPMADGGEGTVAALVEATGGHIVHCEAQDALGRPIDSFYGILGDGVTAIIEMAAASGIELLEFHERNPWETSTYGTGQLIAHALDNGCQSIIVGIGGSATNDGGTGMAAALGYRFLDARGNELEMKGSTTGMVSAIDTSLVHPKLGKCGFYAACDVKNPLIGEHGASRVYGPQKGGTPEMIEKLDANLTHLAGILQRDLLKNVAELPGSGAAGGLGGGLVAFCNARLKPGIDLIKEVTHLDEKIAQADWVITGEGKIDSQTQYGKTPMGISSSAARFNKPVIALAGTLGEGYESLYDNGFTAIFSIVDKPMPLQEAIQQTQHLLKQKSMAIGRIIAHS